MTWRERWRPVVAEAIRGTADLEEPERTEERKRLRVALYTGCQRRGWAYQAWLLEWTAQLAAEARRDGVYQVPFLEFDEGGSYADHVGPQMRLPGSEGSR